MSRRLQRPAARSRLASMLAVLVALGLAPSAFGQASPQEPSPRKASPERLVVHAHTFEHRDAADAADRIRPLLTHRGTVEEQPGGNTLVVRDVRTSVDHIARLLRELDQPPKELSFDIRIVRAVTQSGLISPPTGGDIPIEAELSPELLERLRGLLRFDEYQVLAQADVRSREGEEVTYALGDRFDVSFRSRAVLGGSRLKLEDFTIVKKPRQSTDKGRRLPPRELFQATLNLKLDKLFIVLAQDPSGGDALMIAISCRPSP